MILNSKRHTIPHQGIVASALLAGLLAAGAVAQARAGDGAASAPDNPAIRRLLDGGHFKRSRAALEPRLPQNPNDAEVNFLFSQVKQAYRDLDSALKLAEKAASLNPKSGEYRYQVAEVVGEQAEDASIFRQPGLARRFKREAEAALALDPNLLDPRWALMEFHMRAPGIVGGNKETAKQMLAEIKQRNPARGYLAEARMWQLEKKTDSPEPLYLKAVEADPNNFTAHMNLARLYASATQKKFELAEKHAKEARHIAPDRTGGYSLLAYIYCQQQRWKDLDALLAEAEKAVPDSLTPFYQVAAALNQMNVDLPRAERAAQKYLTIEPEPNTPKHEDTRKLLAQIQAKLKGRK